MTGLELYKIFQQNGGMNYGGYYAGIQGNRLFKQATFYAIEQVYRTLGDQRDYDKLNALIKANVVLTPSANAITLIGTGSQVTDYLHLLNCDASFAVLFPDVQPDNFTNTTPVVMYQSWYSFLREGMKITVSGAGGNAGANGTWYLKQAGVSHGIPTYGLYQDAQFVVGAIGSGTYTDGTASISLSYENKNCRQQISVEKGAVLQSGTIDYPLYALEDYSLRVYPLDTALATCTSVRIDYLTQATVLPDITDTTVNLEQTYPYLFLTENIVNQALLLAAQEFRDGELQKDANTNLIKTN